MKKLIIASAIMISPLLFTTAHAVEASTKVEFSGDSYCGSFSGNLYDGKRFRLWLSPEQELVIRNQGNDQVNIAYVEGPSGRLNADRHETFSSFYTKSNGNHYIKLYGNSRYSSVEFCAY